jgi:hypothetical protein
MALDWIQLCILPARQSYIRQYGNMTSGPEKAFSVLALVLVLPFVSAERAETITQYWCVIRTNL